MNGHNGEKASINSFALVLYLPEPLAGFLDCLRSDLAQDQARAHLTVLPPRPILGPAEQAWEEIKVNLEDIEPFCVELGEIEIFRETQVIYLGIVSGFAQLDRLHAELNRGLVKFDEPFQYHPHVTVANFQYHPHVTVANFQYPHVTVAKEMGTDLLSAAVETATLRWREFPDSRRFNVDSLTFVQNPWDDRWIDLHACRLAARVAT